MFDTHVTTCSNMLFFYKGYVAIKKNTPVKSGSAKKKRCLPHWFWEAKKYDLQKINFQWPKRNFQA